MGKSNKVFIVNNKSELDYLFNTYPNIVNYLYYKEGCIDRVKLGYSVYIRSDGGEYNWGRISEKDYQEYIDIFNGIYSCSGYELIHVSDIIDSNTGSEFDNYYWDVNDLI